MLADLAAFTYRRRRLVIACWAVLLACLVCLAALAPGATSDEYTVPGSDSERAAQVLEAHGLHDDQAGGFRVVFGDDASGSHKSGGDDGLSQPEFREAVGEVVRRVAEALPGAEVTGPFDPGAQGQVSPDGSVAFAEVVPRSASDPTDSGTSAATIVERMESVGSPLDGLQVAFSGPMFESSPGGGPGEGIGMLLAAVILFLGFGSLLAMGLPLLVAVFGAGCGVAAVMLAAHLVGMSSAAVPLAAMLAVGVGIDYSLFVVTRYRECLAAGLDPADAVRESQRTAGRSVFFAGATVILAVLGLLTMNMPLINGVAVGAALAIAMTMAAALTLLPALLGAVGTSIDRFGLPHRRRKSSGDGQLARRWSRVVHRRPWPYAIGALVLLAVLTVPALSMRLGFSDAGTLPATNTARQAHDMLARGFGPGVNGPLFVVVESGADADLGAVPAGDPAAGTASADPMTQLADAIAGMDGVATVSPVIRSADEHVAMLVVTPTTGPSDAATADLVRSLQEQVRGVTLGEIGPGTRGYVTGATAAVVDYSDFTSGRLPLFLGVILALAFVLLTAVFRSVIVAAKAVLVNVLSIGAAFGVLVAAIQFGWGSALFGLDEPIPVVAWVPMMMVAVVFGLSMDYEVFLLSRIKEHHDAGESNAAAVAYGLAGTARVITVAAAIMVCVFASFMLGGAIDLAVFGFGLAVAVLIDATLVRLVLVPAVMELFGERNWWLPGWARQWAQRRAPRRPGPTRTSSPSDSR